MRRFDFQITLLLAPILIAMALASLPAAAQETSVPEPTTQERVFEERTVEEKPSEEVKSTNPWYMTLVGGVYSGSQLLEIPARLNLKDSYTFGVSVSKQFAEWTRYIRFEGALQAITHFGDPDHWEFTGSVNARWVVFPWNRHVETTTAFGEGLSWATEIPALEKADPTNSSNAQLLNYILLEVTFAIPESPWSLVTRIHHRSGVF